ncbi:MAG: hypothetical protein V3V96_14245 [Acidiferrobacterales bacterium]
MTKKRGHCENQDTCKTFTPMVERWLSNGILRLIVQVGVICISVGILLGKVSAVQNSVDGLTRRVTAIEAILMRP